jgi:hypothetical protein
VLSDFLDIAELMTQVSGIKLEKIVTSRHCKSLTHSLISKRHAGAS